MRMSGFKQSRSAPVSGARRLNEKWRATFSLPPFSNAKHLADNSATSVKWILDGQAQGKVSMILPKRIETAEAVLEAEGGK